MFTGARKEYNKAQIFADARIEDVNKAQIFTDARGLNHHRVRKEDNKA